VQLHKPQKVSLISWTNFDRDENLHKKFDREKKFDSEEKFDREKKFEREKEVRQRKKNHNENRKRCNSDLKPRHRKHTEEIF
jgi:hypothetical protein